MKRLISTLLLAITVGCVPITSDQAEFDDVFEVCYPWTENDDSTESFLYLVLNDWGQGISWNTQMDAVTPSCDEACEFGDSTCFTRCANCAIAAINYVYR